eukprot:SAG11_NODE_10074_length_858_cov_1.040843_1_plen_119_part_01
MLLQLLQLLQLLILLLPAAVDVIDTWVKPTRQKVQPRGRRSSQDPRQLHRDELACDLAGAYLWARDVDRGGMLTTMIDAGHSLKLQQKKAVCVLRINAAIANMNGVGGTTNVGAVQLRR